MPTVRRIYVELPPQLSSRRLREQARLAYLLLVTAAGLSVYLTLTRTWFFSFVPTAITLLLAASALFMACSIFVLSKLGWRGLWSSPEPLDDTRQKLWPVLLIFTIGLWAYVESPLLHQVFERLPRLEAYQADPKCSSAAMYELALTKEDPGPAAAPPLSGEVCEVKWVQVTASGHQMASHPYTYFLWSYQGINDLRKGDFVVVQTAFGRISAVLYPSAAFEDRLTWPRGRVIPALDNPIQKFEGPYMLNFWALLFLTFTGAAIVGRLWLELRNWGN